MNPRPSFIAMISGLMCLGLIVPTDALAATGEKGVYQYVVDPSNLGFEEAATALEGKIDASPFELVARLDTMAPDGCASRARVYVLHDPDYATRLLDLHPATGAFAIPLRINLFEDERGVHVSVVNPENVNRTILLDDTTFDAVSHSALESLRKLVLSSVPGSESRKQYGPIRKKGHIGKTMGVMAGGPFDTKIKSLTRIADSQLPDVVGKLQRGFDRDEGKWGMQLAYSLVLEEQGVAILGITGPGVEAKSFNIVKQGGDASRKKMSCPGIAHAAAYPIELVVTRSGDRTEIVMVEAMYRMKMFFEDAGKWAFMKNMGMPGSIADEVESRVATALQ